MGVSSAGLIDYAPKLGVMLDEELLTAKSTTATSEKRGRAIVDALSTAQVLVERLGVKSIGPQTVVVLSLLPDDPTDPEVRGMRADAAKVCLEAGVVPEDVAKVMGSDWVSKTLAGQKLRPLPWLIQQNISPL
jgi:hypothetical protein